MESKYSEILKANRVLADKVGGQPYRIAILQNIMTSNLNEILEYYLRLNNVNAQVLSGDYDNIVQNSAGIKDTEAVIVFWELLNTLEGGQYRIDAMSESELDGFLERMKGEIGLVLNNLRDVPLVVFNRFSTLCFNSRYLRQWASDRICRELNEYLEKEARGGVKIADIERVIAMVSVQKAIDLRSYYAFKLLYSVDFCRKYVEQVLPLFLSACGRMKKALIFDCDNTLWKGILGEDGFNGIQMSGDTREGIFFEEVQLLALALSKRGVIIGLCSKNNPEDVDQVISSHPSMRLREQDIVVKKVNWDDKVSNLKAIAEQLNIGLDSMVFVDDTDFEVNLIRKYLPEVTVLQVPKKLHEYPRMIRDSVEMFYTLVETSEDLRKVEMYKQESARLEAKKKFTNLEEYLSSMDLKMSIWVNERSFVPRISQMTQKTNQFNLTTKRYAESDIWRLMSEGPHYVFSFEVRDRFGDYGLTGLCIIRVGGRSGVVDTFLMSCRVLGRNLEIAFFDFIAGYLKGKGIGHLEAVYLKTAKNDQVMDLYEKLGFEMISKGPDRKDYVLDLDDYRGSGLRYIQIGVSNSEGDSSDGRGFRSNVS